MSREYSERFCAWCRVQLNATKRSGARTCSKPCRQAAHRFRVGRAGQLDGAERPMRFGYADPPYPGLARKYYGCAEVDHRQLIDRLVADFPDGWALSTSSKALRDVLLLCPPGVRVAAWVRGARKVPSYLPLDGWEPLIVSGGRLRRRPAGQDVTNVLLGAGHQRSHPGALVGMKSAAFCEWMFRQLGAAQGDELADLFLGSGAVTRAWELFASPRSSATSSLPSRLAGAERRLAELSRAPGRSRSSRRDTSAGQLELTWCARHVVAAGGGDA